MYEMVEIVLYGMSPYVTRSDRVMTIHQYTKYALVQVMACRLFGAKLLPGPMLFVVSRTLGNKS